eukprot:CAMPEP_0115888166 /NCGR_PEP_ID=MMETSP0287-20121206/32166_1 /TAXON_ID=412157 /ORGANISM="Chrysochromulina rotalis, Strain UIO044" /LENGTH=206 /DNA_ID=CAMNT_0003344839 /DNA_START=62 /DNA_END=683 /DNA_ORIENTATION=+
MANADRVRKIELCCTSETATTQATTVQIQSNTNPPHLSARPDRLQRLMPSAWQSMLTARLLPARAAGLLRPGHWLPVIRRRPARPPPSEHATKILGILADHGEGREPHAIASPRISRMGRQWQQVPRKLSVRGVRTVHLPGLPRKRPEESSGRRGFNAHGSRWETDNPDSVDLGSLFGCPACGHELHFDGTHVGSLGGRDGRREHA